MAWFEIADGGLRFRGRVTREPIQDWLVSEDGTRTIQSAAVAIRFSLFGRASAARRRLRRSLWAAIDSSVIRDAIAAEAARYLGAWTALAYAPSLPRLSVEYRRVVVVPRVMIAWRIAPQITARIVSSLQAPDVPESFKTFFARWVVGRMDDAVRLARPCPQRPLHAQESWACVALDSDLVWVDPFVAGPLGQGHVVMFEMPAPRLPRRDRHRLQEAIEQLTQSLPNLTRSQRDHTVRVALDQMVSVKA
jgi:hypothetical protein